MHLSTTPIKNHDRLRTMKAVNFMSVFITHVLHHLFIVSFSSSPLLMFSPAHMYICLLIDIYHWLDFSCKRKHVVYLLMRKCSLIIVY